MANEGGVWVRGAAPAVQEAARILRREMTPAERVLWKALRGKRLDGMGFRRQHPVGRFILDFYAPLLHLAIEVDGPVHDTQAEHDAERTVILEAHSYRVLRFRNDEVLENLPEVLEKIRAAVKVKVNPHPRPLPRSWGRGRGWGPGPRGPRKRGGLWEICSFTLTAPL